MKKPLCVVACHFNPQRYERPRKNFAAFLQHMESFDVDVRTIELVYDTDEPAKVYSDRQHRWDGALVYASREHSLLFQKESLLNILIRELVAEYDAIAWIDADILFANPNWPAETIRELGRSHVCQLFGNAVLTDAQYDAWITLQSVGWRLSVNDILWSNMSMSHPGFAWAARSEVLAQTGGLFEYGITGCGDTLMLHAFSSRFNGLGRLGDKRSEIGDRCYACLESWEATLPKDLRVGFVNGAIVHMYHGQIQNRSNLERRFWLKDLDPMLDLRRDSSSGVLEFVDPVHPLAMQLLEYFTARKEDE